MPNVSFYDYDNNQKTTVTESKRLPVKASGSYIGNGVVNPNFTVTPSGVEVKVGATALGKRHTVSVVNDASTMISISIGTNAAFADSMKLFSGAAIQLSLPPHEYVPIYVRTPYFNATVGIIESAEE